MRAWALLVACGCSFRHGVLPPDGQLVGDSARGDGSWWNPAWHWRMPITITNNASASLPAGYQVGLAHDLDAAPCTSNRDDIRIVRADVDIARVIDEVGTVEWTWFPLAAAIPAGATATDYWLYCGNPSPTPAPSDPTTVFDFYDGFDTQVDNSVWTSQHTVKVASGKLVCGGGGMADSGVVTKNLTFGSNHAVDWVAIASSTTNSDFWAGFQNGTMDVPPFLQWWANVGNAISPDYQAPGGALWLGTSVLLDTAPHVFTFENYGTQSMYRYDDVSYESHVYDIAPPDQVSVRLWNGSDQTVVSYDWVRVRQAVNPPPTTAVGAPEMY